MSDERYYGKNRRRINTIKQLEDLLQRKNHIPKAYKENPETFTDVHQKIWKEEITEQITVLKQRTHIRG